MNEETKNKQIDIKKDVLSHGRDFICFSTLESKMGLICAILCIAVSIPITITCGSNDYINTISILIKDIAIGLIGFLGFVIAGLAIITSIISKKVVYVFKQNNAYSQFISILCSFYFIGIVAGFLIAFGFLIYVVTQINVRSYAVLNIAGVTLFTYFTAFTLFYCVGLMKNCIDLFDISNSVETKIIDKEKLKQKYEEYRILALESITLRDIKIDKMKAYSNSVYDLIYMDTTTTLEEKEILAKWNKMIFGE